MTPMVTTGKDKIYLYLFPLVWFLKKKKKRKASCVMVTPYYSTWQCTATEMSVSRLRDPAGWTVPSLANVLLPLREHTGCRLHRRGEISIGSLLSSQYPGGQVVPSRPAICPCRWTLGQPGAELPRTVGPHSVGQMPALSYMTTSPDSVERRKKALTA